ncbi:MAG: penicillin-binding protein activator, partial [bacterium]|nr:penicillin-binding protein activator [bacterium]
MYARAERLRTNGQFAQARQIYANFIQRYPGSPLADDALLAIARVAAAQADDRDAQRTYEKLLTSFPASNLVTQAYLELGISYYQTQDFERSAAALRQMITRSPDPQQLALARYHLGLMAIDKQRFLEAIKALKVSVETGSQSDLSDKARSQIYRIVHDHLKLPALEQLLREYPAVYPGDEVLLQQARLFQAAGRLIDEIATLRHFTTAFGDHPRMPKVLQRLRELQASLTTDRTKIGVLLPLSGEVSQYGQNALRGIELALLALRERHPETTLSIVVRDSHLSGSTAGDTLRSLVNDAHVISVVGPLLSQVALDLAPVAEELQVPLISPYAPDGDFPALSSYTFRNSMTDNQQARFLAEYAINARNLRRFAVLYPDEPYGIAFKDRFVEHIIQLGGEVTTVVSYPPDTNDFSPQIKQLGGIDDTTLRDFRAGMEQVTDNPNDIQLRPPLFDAI